VVAESMPNNWFALTLILWLGVTWRLLPITGSSSWQNFVMPAIALGYYVTPAIMRLTRAGMLEVLSADYIRTARAKGLSERKVVFKHALRNAVLPIITVAGIQFGNLISGALLVESVFNWPGMGRLAFDAVLRRDYPTLLGILFFAALMVVVVNLLTDLSYRFADPRIRTGGR